MLPTHWRAVHAFDQLAQRDARARQAAPRRLHPFGGGLSTAAAPLQCWCVPAEGSLWRIRSGPAAGVSVGWACPVGRSAQGTGTGPVAACEAVPNHPQAPAASGTRAGLRSEREGASEVRSATTPTPELGGPLVAEATARTQSHDFGRTIRARATSRPAGDATLKDSVRRFPFDRRRRMIGTGSRRRACREARRANPVVRSC